MESDGALIVPSEDVMGSDGNPATLMVPKEDGGYSYDTTDLATIRYRIEDLKADCSTWSTPARRCISGSSSRSPAARAG